ncbi:ABC transporter with metal-binding/Fe-S-binding domain ATP-binding protein [Methanocalculus alkaliphilus]|uniref:diphthine--ammonia ligase n=1 Tax=Methanocalculus alkaliphilus TaxID=768730 RepID=UPI00209F7B38|nr:diphthine--ammonia ligase [Methanocalculus alkaliphilus]MCP1715030.1 ABC transporter with metal-binding/Fe-S-binding domain ATP-binding protein [Methanocalculus alkaliphilus]
MYAALTSGGKDSVLSIQMAMDKGLDVGYIVCVRPENPDSYMFHSSNLDAVRLIASRGQMEYVEIRSHGRKEEELADLKNGLQSLPITGLIAGAIASRYQYERVGEIAKALDLEIFAPLWERDPEWIMEQVAQRLDAIIVVCAADGLGDDLLGAHIDEALIDRLKRISSRNRIHIAGEGGEYETLTLNAPFYSEPIHWKGEERLVSPGRSELILDGLW